MKKELKSFLAVTAALVFSAGSAASLTDLSVCADENDGMSEMVSDAVPPDMPDGEGEGNVGDGETPPDKPDGDAPGGGEAPGGNSSVYSDWTAVTEYGEDTETDGETYSSTGTDENAVLISGGNVVLNNPVISKINDSSTGGDNSSFYGVGAAVLASSGTAFINGGTIDTDSKGGAGAFAYNEGTVYIQDTVINTSESTSGGIHAAGGGTLYAWGLDVTTNGESSAAIRSDRGGGTMVVDGGTYTSRGTGSPAVYCTADIAVNNAELNAENSEGVCIEGLNSLHIFNSDLTSDMPETEQNENLVWAVIVYQSMSGDSEVGNSEFYMDGGSIAGNGDIFYTTNTESHITVKNVEITSSADGCAVLRATGNANGRGWGSAGSNGADCTFTAIDQELNGDVIYDSISNLEFYLTEGSKLVGAVVDDETDAGDGGDAEANIYIDESSEWTVTGDSVCTNLYCAGAILDESGLTVTIADESGNALSEGESEYTVTVTGTYSEEADVSGAAASSSFDEYSVEKPEVFLTGTTAGADESSLETTEEEEIAEDGSNEESTEEEQSDVSEDEEDSSESDAGFDIGLIDIGIGAAGLVIGLIIGFIIGKVKRK